PSCWIAAACRIRGRRSPCGGISSFESKCCGCNFHLGGSMELKVTRQRVLITAGAGGIGRVMAETFVEAGAKVHICDVAKSTLDDTVKTLGVTATLCDVSNLK